MQNSILSWAGQKKLLLKAKKVSRWLIIMVRFYICIPSPVWPGRHSRPGVLGSGVVTGLSSKCVMYIPNHLLALRLKAALHYCHL
jgi:hypothetical protein